MRTLIISIWLLVSLPVFSNLFFIKLVGDYYSVDPFQATFSAFYNSLRNERFLLNKEFSRSENGESLDGFAAYKVFNPFSVNANSIKASLKNEETIIYYSIKCYFVVIDDCAYSIGTLSLPHCRSV